MSVSEFAAGAKVAAAASAPQRSGRLLAVDTLRGMAALAVVAFHYTTRFTELYGAQNAPASYAVPWGHHGVNLFFIISGLVIFMTLERTKRPLDFVVSRFSRLFPAYWAAVALTFTVVSVFGLPGKEVSTAQAAANLAMVHGLARVPHVDGVYWTLEVEMLFYAGTLALFMAGRLRRIHFVLWALLSLRIAYQLLSSLAGIELSWTLSRLLILPYLPWFALGMCIYQYTRAAARPPTGVTMVTVSLITVALLVKEGAGIAALAAILAALVWLAATGRARWLENPVLSFFGTISYPLYLLHENIGWVVQRAVLARGGSMDLSILVAFVVAVALATLLTFAVERPAMKAIRARYAAARRWPS